MVSAEAGVDPGTSEVIRNYLVSAASEMQRTLTRTAYNTVIYNALDFGISIYDRNLDLVADNPGLSLFLGSNDYALERLVDHVGENPRSGRKLVEGEHTSGKVATAIRSTETPRRRRRLVSPRATRIDYGVAIPLAARSIGT